MEELGELTLNILVDGRLNMEYTGAPIWEIGRNKSGRWEIETPIRGLTNRPQGDNYNVVLVLTLIFLL